MLKHLHLQNFKSWENLRVDFKPITAFFGANSSGKSSIIQFLLMLKQTKDSQNSQAIIDFGDHNTPVELGNFKDIVYQHDVERQLQWQLKWDIDKPLIFSDVLARPRKALATADLALRVNVVSKGRQVTVQSMAYRAAGLDFEIAKRADKPGYQLISSNEEKFRFVRNLGRPWDLPEPTRCYSYPDQAQALFQNTQFLGLFENAYVNQVDRILHLGPLREDPKRQYPWSGNAPGDVGRRGERAIEAILSAREAGERRNLKYKSPTKSFEEMVAWWLKELGLISQFRVEEVGTESGLFRAYVSRGDKSVETLITDVGFGVSQILPVITLLYYAPKGSTILIEQPEIHLHPSVQAGLADLFISATKTRELQIIVESHSEHFLNRLMRRVAEEDTKFGNVEPDDVGLYFCEYSNGRSKIQNLEVNLFGGITNWPKDFFGDQIGEIVARERAAAAKRRTQSA